MNILEECAAGRLRIFPIMSGKILRGIPWRLIEDHTQQAEKNHSQNLDRLAARGGLSPREALCVIEGLGLPAIEEREAELALCAEIYICLKITDAFTEGGTK